MDELSMVFTNMLMESTCYSGLCAIHSELGESHRRRKFVTTKSHSKGSEISHSISSQENIDGEVDEIKLDLEMMRGFIQKGEEDQGFR